MDFVCKLYGNTYAVHETVALVGVATLNLALPAPPPSNENMKNFNFPLKHWCWIKIINTTGCDPLLKLGRCYPIEINNGRVKSTPNNVIF